ncbi:hypothetical protein ACLF4E_004199 [Cronobacter malonaticus]|uniref:hypothetical protein n=1 Tax=Cronobacter sakazakii TaxID=28141 RepID=UPI0009431020|nr:hypothetical protein [Cronobacter sakazakii]EAV5731185.1 hypothetical protein [Salmonella enterica]EDC9289963.1 hypothetical protein [Salmonella enterica subsp. enterica serovar Enteritidis]EDT3546908.1 hypothetical protein [Salmonella enterica subsp. enterica serovar Thompson]EJI5534766.1 hypothetical protein [Escherichia coli]EAX8453159.1 hypothetical protein [Salmonella enterica]
MRINVDVFARLLNVKPGEIVWAVNHGNVLAGLELPPSKRGIENIQSNGPKSLTFDVLDATEFAKKYIAATGSASSKCS